MTVSTSLRGRVPGQAVIDDIVCAQAHVRPRSRLARFFGVSPLAASSRPMYRAAEGEVEVGRMLEQLGPQWDVLHVVPVDDLNGRIDHLAIGPAGVFALFTANFPGQEVRVNGETMSIGARAVDDLQTIRRLSENAAERLGNAAGRAVDVQPVLIVIDPTRLALRKAPEGMQVVSSRALMQVLTRADRSLAGSEVAYISDVADRETTWESAFASPERALQLSRDFGALRETVRSASQVRLAWSLLAFVGLASLAWATIAAFVGEVVGR